MRTNVKNGRSVRWMLLFVPLLLLFSAPLGCQRDEQPPPEPATRPAETPIDDDYVDALATANEFCNAWKSRDYAAGRALMSRDFIRRYPEKRLRAALEGMPNPQHVAFEIFDGEPLRDGRIAFKVRQLFRYTGQIDDRIEGPLQRIVIIRDDSDKRGKWLVGDFPIP